MIKLRWTASFLFTVLLTVCGSSLYAEPDVRIMRVPDGGIQPQAAVDAKGVVHLIYYKGKPKAGNIYYVRSTDDAKTFSKPIRVNSGPNSAVAIGTIRGPHMAIGKDSRIHVAWNGSRETIPVDRRKEHGLAPMLYTRLNNNGTAFEKQRNLMTKTHGLDGGGSVAADNKGNVYVAWHGVEKGKAMREEERAVWVAYSSNDGQSFGKEKRVNEEPMGACGCCGMKAGVDPDGRLYLMYRTAQQFINRDMRLLVSSDNGNTFKGTTIDHWRVGQCPMSSTSITSTKGGTLLAWETNKQVMFKIENPAVVNDAKPIKVFSRQNAKHPLAAINNNGQCILVWLEGSGWNRAGKLAWQVYGQNGKPIGKAAGRGDDVPLWSYSCVIATTAGQFVIFR